jgi:hypothetical protein
MTDIDAMRAGPELDMLVAVHVAGWVETTVRGVQTDGISLEPGAINCIDDLIPPPPNYSVETDLSLDLLAMRFRGWTLDHRPFETTWPAPYRLRIVANKNERAEWRVEAYGNHIAEAVCKAAVKAVGWEA